MITVHATGHIIYISGIVSDLDLFLHIHEQHSVSTM